jgi:hypothetical protein
MTKVQSRGIREQLKPVHLGKSQDRPRTVSRGGKTYTQNTAAIGRPRCAEAEPEAPVCKRRSPGMLATRPGFLQRQTECTGNPSTPRIAYTRRARPNRKCDIDKFNDQHRLARPHMPSGFEPCKLPQRLPPRRPARSARTWSTRGPDL